MITDTVMRTYIFNDYATLSALQKAAGDVNKKTQEADDLQQRTEERDKYKVRGTYDPTASKSAQQWLDEHPERPTVGEVKTTFGKESSPKPTEEAEATPVNRIAIPPGTEIPLEATLARKNSPNTLPKVKSPNPRVTAHPQPEKASDKGDEQTRTTPESTSTPTTTRYRIIPTEPSTMSDKPKNTGSQSGTPASTDEYSSINELLEEKQKGALLTGDRTAYKLTDPVKYTMADAMHYPSGFAMKNTAFASPSVKVAYDDNGKPGWMMSGTGVPKAFREQKTMFPLDALMREQFFGFINDDGSLDREAEIIYENGYVVDNLKQAAVRFFEALSICRNANNGNMSPEYQRAMAQFTQFGHVVLSMLKTYNLDTGLQQYGFAQSPASTTGTGYSTPSQPTTTGTNPTRTTGRSAYDGSSDWYIDELASRRKAMEQIQTNPQLWYLRGLNF